MSVFYLVGTLLDGRVPSQYQHILEHTKVFVDTYTTAPALVEGILADRKILESNRLIDELNHCDVALVVYGDPLIATTHHTLAIEARRRGHEVKILHGVSGISAVISESGLQIYRFGPVVTIPRFEPGFQPLSPAEKILSNRRRGQHTLALVDPRMDFAEVLDVLRFYERRIGPLRPFLIISTGKALFWMDEPKPVKAPKPFSLIFPAKLHPMEKEYVEIFAKRI